MLKKLLIVSALVILIGCTGGGTAGSSGSTPVNVSTAGIIIDPMTIVPVINGSSTQGTLYIHNYSDQVISGLNYSLNKPTTTSQIKSVLSSVGFNISGGIEDSNGFVLLNPERCRSIAANSSCAINFATPNLSFGNQGNSLVSISYKSTAGKSATTSQVVNYNYVDGTNTSGVNFTGSLEVNGVAGTTKYIVGYLYAGGASGGLYKGVNLVASNPSARITGGFVNNQEIATNQVIAVEFAVAIQNTTNSYVNITPTWSQGASISTQAGGVGGPLALSIVPGQNVASYLFGDIPILVASPSTTGSINVVNNGTADGTAISVAKSGDSPDGITLDTSNCNTNPPQAYANSPCVITYTLNTYAPGSATLTYKNSSDVTIGSQVVYWTNDRALPAVKIEPSLSNITMNQGESIMIQFTVQNVGNLPLESLVITPYVTGTATWVESSGASNCGSSIGINATCTMSGSLVASSDGPGVLYYSFKGSYNGVSYSFLSLPVYYTALGSPLLSLTPVQVVSVQVLANNESAVATTYSILNSGTGRAIFDAISLEAMANLNTPVISDSSTCKVGNTLNLAESCTVIVTYGPEDTNISINESGSTRLVVDSHGGTPISVASQLVSESYYYSLVGNDTYAIESIVAHGFTGMGSVESPYIGQAVTPLSYLDIVYTNPSVNYPLTNFNLNTNNLPYGMVVDDRSDCPTGADVQDIPIGGHCLLCLRLDHELLAKSSQGGSVGLDFVTPKATWTTPLGFYSQAGNSITMRYLQPSVSISLSNNNGMFESTVVTAILSNESAGTGPVVFNISGVSDWLESEPLALTNNCTINPSSYGVSCSLASGAESGVIRYFMPNYLQSRESATIPLFYTRSGLGSLSSSYSLINYIEIRELVIFMTYSTYDGNLGGLAGADARCNADFNKPIEPAGAVYKALLNTSSTSNNATQNGLTYYRPDRTTVIATATGGFLTNNLVRSITTVNTTAWTGSTISGDPAGNTCSGWTANSGAQGNVGLSGSTSGSWAYYSSENCSAYRYLYCVQQPR